MEIQDPTSKKYPNSKKLLNWGIVTFALTTIIVIFMPVIVTKNSWISLGIDKPNEIGDTIGGILGPCVGLIAAALTFLAFWAQYDANIEQRKQFDQSLYNEKVANAEEKTRLEQNKIKENEEFSQRQNQFELTQKLQQDQIVLQDKRSRINLFETRFYTMLSIQRDNAIGMEVNNIKGRKVFLHMLEELNFIYNVFSEEYEFSFIKTQKLEPEDIFNVAYLSFFFGIGEKSTPLVKDLVTPELQEFVNKTHQIILKATQDDHAKFSESIEITINKKVFKWEKVYSLGVGHLRRLSHYIRHLFQIVKFVDDQPSELLKQDEKYSYISNLRAQLSVHEQLLLFYNALSVLGKPWLDIPKNKNENYIEQYCMLKSIPLNAADFYKRPEDMFPALNKSEKAMFEWTEIKARMAQLAKN